VGVVLLGSGCGGGSSHPNAMAHTTVQRYDVYPADTISVSSANPTSKECHSDAVGLAGASAQFVSRSGPKSWYPADLSYVLIREELADFAARKCDPQLLGTALKKKLSPAQRQVLLTHAPRPAADALRQALSAAGE
jgi:hypothetical protein